MSYVRFSETSDVYVYEDARGRIHCCGCSLADDCTAFRTRSAMCWHLIDHELVGDVVPGYVYENLRTGLEHGPGEWVHSQVPPL